MLAERANEALGQDHESASIYAHDAILLRVGQWAHQDRVHQRINDSVGPDSKRQRQYRDDREPRSSAHLSQCESHILQKSLQRRQRGAIAVGLPGLFCAAEPHHRPAPRLLTAQPLPCRCVNVHRNVALELGIKFNCVAAHEDSAQSQQKCTQFVQNNSSYSVRNACIGSIEAARRAGSQQAMSAIKARMIGTKIKVSESCG